MYHPIDRRSLRNNVQTNNNDSKASVYYTPSDTADQQLQLQMSPMHINIIQENLDSFPDCLKPSESMCKFDFDMHRRLETNLQEEIERRRSRHIIYTEDDDETMEINSEKTKMLNCYDDDDDDVALNSTQGYIRLNTLPKRNKYKRATNSRDFYYSLENVFDAKMTDAIDNYQLHLSNKTIDEASCEDNNYSSNDTCRSNPTRSDDNSDDQQSKPSQSALSLNEVTLTESRSLTKSENLTKEQIYDDAEHTIVIENDSQLDHMLPN